MSVTGYVRDGLSSRLHRLSELMLWEQSCLLLHSIAVWQRRPPVSVRACVRRSTPCIHAGNIRERLYDAIQRQWSSMEMVQCTKNATKVTVLRCLQLKSHYVQIQPFFLQTWVVHIVNCGWSWGSWQIYAWMIQRMAFSSEIN